LLKPMSVKLRAFTVQFGDVGVENIITELHGSQISSAAKNLKRGIPGQARGAGIFAP